MSIGDRSLRVLAVAMLVVYLAWQVWWLSQGQLPPALFWALTGWPAPTTGGTRSLLALLEGDWRRSLYFNAMTVPILSVLAVSVICLAYQFGLGLRLRLPPGLVWAWMGVLALAWAIKLTQAVMD